MESSPLNFALAAPEILLLVLALGLLVIDAFSKSADRVLTYRLSQLSLLAVFVVCLMQWRDGAVGMTFHGMYVADPLSHLLKALSVLAVSATLAYGQTYSRVREMAQGELYVLALLALLGQFVMISAASLVSVFLGLELMSLALYALVALRRDNRLAVEAAMKYFVLGALATGFLLYGMSMLYGATGELGLRAIAFKLQQGSFDPMVLTFGLVFIVSGLAFKLGVVPFHMWVPDVYHGSPTSATLLLGGAPKLAAFAIVVRLLVEALPALGQHWMQMLAVLAVLSLAIGNLTAIMQTNFKRMLAYSTISHMGFVLLGLLAGAVPGTTTAATAYGAALFYVITYVLSTLATFGLILYLSRRDGFEADEISDLSGLSRRHPWVAFLILLMMASLAGLPPLVGFQAKLTVLQALVEAGQVPLAVVAVIFSLIGAFYYLRVIKVVWFDEPSEAQLAAPVEASASVRGLLSVNSLLLLVLGILPGPLLVMCTYAMSASLGL